MRWKDREESSNIEDRRGMSPKGAVAGLGGVGILVAVVYALLTGQNPLNAVQQAGDDPGTKVSQPRSVEEEGLRKFTAVTLKDTEIVWDEEFRKLGKSYAKPTLVMFTGRVESGCGMADAGMGPFYCGNDDNIYIDLSFYQMLKERFGAKGDFAQAYVIAHEVGHHVQDELGILDKVHSMRDQLNEKQNNQLSVRLELQADYLAGVWAHHARKMEELTEQDLRDAMEAANSIGDDAIQSQAQGYVVPDAFTHGTSEQRVRWFMKGWQSGDPLGGDTFSSKNL